MTRGYDAPVIVGDHGHVAQRLHHFFVPLVRFLLREHEGDAELASVAGLAVFRHQAVVVVVERVATPGEALVQGKP